MAGSTVTLGWPDFSSVTSLRALPLGRGHRSARDTVASPVWGLVGEPLGRGRPAFQDNGSLLTPTGLGAQQHPVGRTSDGICPGGWSSPAGDTPPSAHGVECPFCVSEGTLGVRGHSVWGRTRVETAPPAQAPLSRPSLAAATCPSRSGKVVPQARRGAGGGHSLWDSCARIHAGRSRA